MGKPEAIRLATEFMARQSGYNMSLAACDAVLIRASECPDLVDDDTWVIHFPIRLDDSILIQVPDTVPVHVNSTTGEVKIRCFL